MQLIAHRGCSAREIENTLPAFRAALDSGADGIETDLRVAQDGSLWLFHDDDLSRLAGLMGSVEGLRGPQLRKIVLKLRAVVEPRHVASHAATEPGRLASLSDLLALLRKARQPDFLLNLELKGPKQNQLLLAGKIAALEEADEFRGLRITVSSFNHAALRALRALSPKIPLAPLWNGRGLFAPVLRTARALEAEALHLTARAVTARRIGAIHKAGCQARVYTVNDAPLAKKLSAIGVDAIFTDDPAALRSRLC